jgi:hypothetical protein
VETKRFRLEGASLPELQARVRREHGDAGRIVSAERVTVGGVRGFFARRHIEVTVEVREPHRADDLMADAQGPVLPVVRQRRRPAHVHPEMTSRLGIIALLDAADETEALLAGSAGTRVDPAAAGASPSDGAPVPVRAPIDVPSTASPDFARLMDELTFATSPTAPPETPVGLADGARIAAGSPSQASGPAPLPDEAPLDLTPGHPELFMGPGDLVLLVGPGVEVLEAARSMSVGQGSPILSGPQRPHDRRTALAARARGVEGGRAVLVVCELPGGFDEVTLAGLADAWAALGADQVWVVVDAGRKPADTQRWVREVEKGLHVDAVAVLGTDGTGTPGTVRRLGLPVGWIAPVAYGGDVSPASRRATAGSQNPFAIG